MNEFLKNDSSLESQFRSIFLFGLNSATYKFALAKSLLELGTSNKGFISLEDLSPIYVKHLLEHVRSGKRQNRSKSSKFIQACELYEANKINYEQLLQVTEREGFKNVLDAFHNLPGFSLESSFFKKDVQGRKLGIVLTDELFKLNEGTQVGNMFEEIEGRWNLVETAWNERNSNLEIKYDIDLEEFFTFRAVTPESYLNSHNRITLTSVRKPLNGYQKGKCFYCYGPISIISNDVNTCDIDHFIPLSVQYNSQYDLDLNGVWNLVLTCADCNRGEENGKFARLPQQHLLERLHKRNEYLIESNHPLKETLIMRTGASARDRRRFLESRYDFAKTLKKPEWAPKFEKAQGF
ncbi:HNH endonuclease domain-containing protein [Neobacillus sp. 179-C4.2 HS]|uniref:HNH endonuclease domain-containing protein n=1 Tax=Neobacillus driksii TaxID=3035913 RepID=A0ABV4YUD5_9BACI|nr:HNH endonuclease domain-containing protein [Neobacillus sp. 179.-C4.2 HS]MDP5192767.1 HNH endonuclease domain-containing protein [Neobacillus sp. 179.-C4.2 HS]